jgi:hypothetical protein
MSKHLSNEAASGEPQFCQLIAVFFKIVPKYGNGTLVVRSPVNIAETLNIAEFSGCAPD